MPEDLHRLSCTQALALIRQNDITVEQYASALLDRIKQRDPLVKAFCFLDRELVLQSARRLDQTPWEERGPLHGLPIGIKDIMLTADMPTEHHSRLYTGAKASGVDAAAVETLRACGALIFGKLHTTEFAGVYEGGPCTNPHDHTRTPGGSSSGSAAAVADFQIPAALGTQTVGSIARPASFNGIVGYKPTFGAISREGCKFYSHTLDTMGIFTRSMEDLSLFASAFALEDISPSPAMTSIKGMKIAFLKTHVWHKADSDTRQAFDSARTVLAAAGASITDLQLPMEFTKLEQWHPIVHAGEGRANFLAQHRLGKHLLHPDLRAVVEDATLTRETLLEALDGSAALRPAWDLVANQYDVIITPSAVGEAPVGLHNTGSGCFNSMWTLLHAPTINLPHFKGSNGMPIGLTLVGARYRDLHLIAIGRLLEAVFANT